MTVEELASAFLAVIPSHEAEFSLTHNSHRSSYMKVAEWEQVSCGMDWVSDEERQKAIESDELWQVQWYPNNPVGFHSIYASSLSAILSYVASLQKESD